MKIFMSKTLTQQRFERLWTLLTISLFASSWLLEKKPLISMKVCTLYDTDKFSLWTVAHFSDKFSEGYDSCLPQTLSFLLCIWERILGIQWKKCRLFENDKLSHGIIAFYFATHLSESYGLCFSSVSFFFSKQLLETESTEIWYWALRTVVHNSH